MLQLLGFVASREKRRESVSRNPLNGIPGGDLRLFVDQAHTGVCITSKAELRSMQFGEERQGVQRTYYVM